MKIGIPRGLYYYRYFAFWKSFFQRLGLEVVVSSETSKQIVEWGVNGAVDGTCLPVKVYYGHVSDLLNKSVDYLFVPRIVSIAKGEFICPKFMGLPDMINSNITGLPPLLAPILDSRKGGLQIMHQYVEIGRRFAPFYRVVMAYREAINEQHQFEQEQYKVDISETGLTIGVLGHEYLLHDDYITMGTIKWLKESNCQVIIPEQIPEKILAQQIQKFPQRMFWTAGRKTLGAANYLFPKVDGIISLSAFACGIDSLTNDFLERYCRRLHIPHLLLSLDEHTGQAGVITRLEAFIELLARRKEIEANNAAHG